MKDIYQQRRCPDKYYCTKPAMLSAAKRGYAHGFYFCVCAIQSGATPEALSEFSKTYLNPWLNSAGRFKYINPKPPLFPTIYGAKRVGDECWTEHVLLEDAPTFSAPNQRPMVLSEREVCHKMEFCRLAIAERDFRTEYLSAWDFCTRLWAEGEALWLLEDYVKIIASWRHNFKKTLLSRPDFYKNKMILVAAHQRRVDADLAREKAAKRKRLKL